jgi:hypothetical protein
MSLLDQLKAKIKDDSGRLVDPDDYQAGLDAALATLSRWRPVVTAEDLAGAGSRDVALPDGWEPEFSALRRVEYPVGQFPEAYLEPEAYDLYDGPDGTVLRLRGCEPPAGAAVRVWWTRARLEADVTGLDADAVANLAAAHCLETLANLFAHTSDPTIQADSVSYQNKSRDFAARAKRARELAYAHFGIKEGEVAPAAASATATARPASWGKRLTH